MPNLWRQTTSGPKWGETTAVAAAAAVMAITVRVAGRVDAVIIIFMGTIVSSKMMRWR